MDIDLVPNSKELFQPRRIEKRIREIEERFEKCFLENKQLYIHLESFYEKFINKWKNDIGTIFSVFKSNDNKIVFYSHCYGSLNKKEFIYNLILNLKNIVNLYFCYMLGSDEFYLMPNINEFLYLFRYTLSEKSLSFYLEN